jgi:hypothetical protein
VEHGVVACRAVIVASEEVALGGTSDVGQQTASLITALRIWTKSPVAQLTNFQFNDIGQRYGSGGSTYHFFSPFAAGADLARTDDFRAFFERSRDTLARPPSALGVALRRMNLMIDQERDADRVLDLCIILEALFQTGDEKQELSYRLSLRTAHFVGGDANTRRTTFDTVKAGYSLRSSIAHGGAVSGNDQQVQDRLEELVFICTRLYCERAAATQGDAILKAIVKELDSFAH